MLKIEKHQEPELFSDENFIKTKKKYLTTLHSTGQADYRLFNKFRQDIVKSLSAESQNRCVYCEQQIGITSYAQVENFFPKVIYPELAFEWNNLFIACPICNLSKNAFDPQVDGELIILHPALDNMKDQFMKNELGHLIGTSEKAKRTIDLFNLNREALVLERINKSKLLSKLNKEGYSTASSIIDNSYYKNFETSITNLAMLMTTTIENENQK